MYEEDKQLVKQVLSGKEQAFKDFFDRFYSRVYRYARRRLVEQDAEEVAMEVMQLAIRYIESYRGEAALFTWILQITKRQLFRRNQQLNKHQNQLLIDDAEWVRAEVELMVADLTDTPETAQELEQRETLIHHMLDYLPADYGKILEWKYVQGLSVDEIAQQLDLTAIAVQSKLARARKAFRHHYLQLQAQWAGGEA